MRHKLAPPAFIGPAGPREFNANEEAHPASYARLRGVVKR